jgi:PhnB protein
MPVPAIPEGYHSITPYLIVHDGPAALAWYCQALGAIELFRHDLKGGKIAHAELQFGNSRVMLADEFPGMGVRSPKTLGGSGVSLVLYLENVDAVVTRAVEAGALVLRPLEDKFYGDRSATVEDPFGHQWTLSTHIEDVDPAELQRRMAAFQK